MSDWRRAAAAAGIGAPTVAVCYQSKVGPLAWTRPALDEELARAARDRVPVVVNPVAFVSEHSETLVELDIEYREMAERLGVPAYVRVPAVGTADAFVGGLAAVVEAARERKTGLCSGTGERLCPAQFGRCPNG